MVLVDTIRTIAVCGRRVVGALLCGKCVDLLHWARCSRSQAWWVGVALARHSMCRYEVFVAAYGLCSRWERYFA
jgi:hypothetical protein